MKDARETAKTLGRYYHDHRGEIDDEIRREVAAVAAAWTEASDIIRQAGVN